MNKVGGVEFNPENYLTIESLEDGLTAQLSTNACQYSTDCITWTDLDAGTPTPAINTGEKLYFKATGLTPTSNAGIGTFTVSKQFNLLGNCMSMLFGDEAESNLDLTGYDYAFYKLFYNCATLKLISVGFLPATTLANHCYDSMFYGCTSLTTSPELPATTLSTYCYSSMFSGCTSLITSPELPATTLANRCYSDMFYGTNVLPNCTNIDFSSSAVVQSHGLNGLFAGTKVTDSDLRSILPINSDTGNYWLPVTSLATYCYQYMFYGCTGLITSPELPATTLANGCYENMFYGCSNLTTAPELPAMTLSNGCYRQMFYNCSGLTTSPELPAMILATSCYKNMFYGCSNLTTAPDLPATTLATYCYENMFYGCSNLTTAPELPAMTLKTYCYDNMFRNCSKLNYIKAMFTTTPSSSYTNNWVSGVASTGTFVKNADATWDVTGVNGIPEGWTITTETEEVQMIEFTIDGISYQAEEGMTWGEWVNSEYNTIGVYINDYNVVYWSSGFYITDDGLNIYSSEIIENNKGYYKRNETGGV